MIMVHMDQHLEEDTILIFVAIQTVLIQAILMPILLIKSIKLINMEEIKNSLQDNITF